MRITKSHTKSTSTIKASYMPPNPYDVGPPDLKEYSKLDKADYDMEIEFQLSIEIFENGDFDFVGDMSCDPAPDRYDNFTDYDYGVDVASTDTVYDEVGDAIEAQNIPDTYAPGIYNVSGYLYLEYSIDGIEYEDEFLGYDREGSPEFSREHFTDSAEVDIVNATVNNLTITAAVKSATYIRCSQSTLEGKVVKNDGKALENALSAKYDITNIEHSGNFRFTATCADGSTIHIDTEPTDDTESKIKITHINHRSKVNIGTDIIVASEDDYTDDWVELKNKQVLDSDGFTTDYTLYTNSANTRFICMFGDRDVYEPDIDYADWTGDSVEEAYEWFDNYTSYDEDDIYGAESATQSNQVTISGERNYDGSHAFLLKSPVFDDMAYVNDMRELIPFSIESTGYSDTIAVFAEPNQKQTILDAIVTFNNDILHIDAADNIVAL